MKTLLWLDDVRIPSEYTVFWAIPPMEASNVVWVKNYDEFIDYINKNGLPDAINFDHDLADIVYTERGAISMMASSWHEKTGYDCAKWLVDYCMRSRGVDLIVTGKPFLFI